MKQPHKLPDFLIVRTMKSGTSSLADYLKNHRHIHIPRRELHYFDKDKNYNKGPSWYSKTLTAALNGVNEYNTLLVGEKTPEYSYQGNCAERIYRTIPNAKLIWIFRDPVKRSFSNYLHIWKKGTEQLTFRQCVSKEQERIKENIFKGYVEQSKYSIQVERYLSLFNISQMHFLLFENLVRSPHEELNKVADFLDVPRFEELPQVHSNRTIMPFSLASLRLAQKITGYNSKPYRIVRKLNKKLGAIFPKSSPSIPNDLASELAGVLAPYNERLTEITGLDLAPWKASEK
jgi:hypothetical protein